LNTLKLLKQYDRNKHIGIFTDKNTNYINLRYINSDKWIKDDSVPYIIKTHLLDSYYCLPERPDMAFTLLWKCINNSYTELFIKKNPTSEKRLTDSKSIDILVDVIIKNFNVFISEEITIKMMIEKFVENVPIKLTSFIANFVLKNYVLEKKYFDRNRNTIGIANKYISSSYTTFKSKFKDIYQAIINTYGESYYKITKPEIKEGNVYLNINDKNKSRNIIKSLSNKFYELLVKKEILLKDDKEEKSYLIKIKDDKEYINFIIRNFLYAIRNNIIHGKIASRLNSRTKNYIYLLRCMFLTIALYELNYINKEDLYVNIENLEENILKNKY